MLAGGSGTRFWPASRQCLPKPFVPLVGGETPLHATLRRLERLVPLERIRVVVGAELGPLTLESVGHLGPSVLLEPQPRDTAAAIVYAAAVIAGEHPDACVGVFPADHHIPDPEPFVRDVNTAAAAAASGDLVLIGIEPTRPDTAYGYIKLGPTLQGDVCRVARFTEKPDRARAKRFVRKGSYLWNAGMVVAPARRIVEECEKHAPEVWEALGPVLHDAASGRSVEPERLSEGYRGVTKISFDHAVLERSDAVAALPGRFAWSDLGSWDALAEHLPVHDGNRIAGIPPAVNLECSDNVIWNTGEQTLALVGVSGLAVVVTQDALLICPKERAQEVRKVVDALRAQGRADLT